MNWSPAQSPDQAWQLAGRLAYVAGDPVPADTDHAILIQDEPRIRIVLSTSGDGERQVSKIYRTPVALTWRDLFRYPQAQREYENLQYAYNRGLPVARPLGYGLRRRPGRDWYSQLTTAFLEGETLREVLKQETGSLGKLIGRAGEVVAAMHGAGMVWGTAHTGNFMVQSGSGGDGLLTAFDLPYAYCAGKDMTGGRLALYDVWNMAGDMRKHCGLDESLVWEFFDSYAYEAGVDPERLLAQVEARKGKNSVFAERFFIRTVRSFRLRPF